MATQSCLRLCTCELCVYVCVLECLCVCESVYNFVCVWVCVCVYVCVLVCVLVCVCACVCACVCVCAWVIVCVCVCICVWACVCECMCECMCECVYVCVRACVCVWSGEIQVVPPRGAWWAVTLLLLANMTGSQCLLCGVSFWLVITHTKVLWLALLWFCKPLVCFFNFAQVCGINDRWPFSSCRLFSQPSSTLA